MYIKYFTGALAQVFIPHYVTFDNYIILIRVCQSLFSNFYGIFLFQYLPILSCNFFHLPICNIYENAVRTASIIIPIKHFLYNTNTRSQSPSTITLLHIANICIPFPLFLKITILKAILLDKKFFSFPILIPTLQIYNTSTISKCLACYPFYQS